MSELHFFDPHAEFSVIERKLPHWAQPGVICFLTYRTADSMPSAVIQRWVNERETLLGQHGIDPAGDWKTAIRSLPSAGGDSPPVSTSISTPVTEPAFSSSHGSHTLSPRTCCIATATTIR
jgi:hypothetical protein